MIIKEILPDIALSSGFISGSSLPNNVIFNGLFSFQVFSVWKACQAGMVWGFGLPLLHLIVGGLWPDTDCFSCISAREVCQMGAWLGGLSA